MKKTSLGVNAVKNETKNKTSGFASLVKGRGTACGGGIPFTVFI